MADSPMDDLDRRILEVCGVMNKDDDKDYGLPVFSLSPYDPYVGVCRELMEWANACEWTVQYPVRRQGNRFTVRWHYWFGAGDGPWLGRVEKAGTLHLLSDANVVVVSGIAYDLRSNDGATTERYYAIPRGLPLAPRLDGLLADLVLPPRN